MCGFKRRRCVRGSRTCSTRTKAVANINSAEAGTKHMAKNRRCRSRATEIFQRKIKLQVCTARVSMWLGMREVSQRKLQISECLKNRQRDATYADTPLEKTCFKSDAGKSATITPHTRKRRQPLEHEAHRFPGNFHPL